MIYPFWKMLVSSFSSNDAVSMGRVFLLPVGFNFLPYVNIIKESLFLSAFKNSLFITIVGTALNIFITVITAFPFSRRKLPGRRYIFLIFLFTMFFSGGMIPTFLLVTKLKLINTLWALIIPFTLDVYYMILMKNYFQSLPEELIESASIEGCSEFRMIFNIIVPCSLPMIVTITLFYAVYNWNIFVPGIIYLRDQNKFPLEVFLNNLINGMSNISALTKEFQVAEDGRLIFGLENLKSAAIIVTIAPIIAVYPFLQRYFIKGIILGSVKG